MIKFVMRWLLGPCKVERNRIHVRVCINSADKDRINKIHRFWSKITTLPPGQFSKPTFIAVNSRKIYLNPEKYFGTLRIKVKRSTNLRRKILGWIEGLA